MATEYTDAQFKGASQTIAQDAEDARCEVAQASVAAGPSWESSWKT